jgi:DNA-binding FadR family transcriptional regulator
LVHFYGSLTNHLIEWFTRSGWSLHPVKNAVNAIVRRAAPVQIGSGRAGLVLQACAIVRASRAWRFIMIQNDGTLTKVREFIERQNIALDGRIPPERTLAAELGVGRRSVRRALDILEQEGRIHRHQGRGTFIDVRSGAAGSLPTLNGAPAAAGPVLGTALENLLDYTNPLEVIEVRLATEPVMARLAALRASQAEIKRLAMLAEKTRTAGDAESYERADSLFHRTIAEASRNTLFLAFFDTMHSSQRDASWRRLGENSHCFKRQSVYATFHESIAAAIETRNGLDAYTQMHRHLSDVQQYIHEQAFPRSEAPQ